MDSTSDVGDLGRNDLIGDTLLMANSNSQGNNDDCQGNCTTTQSVCHDNCTLASIPAPDGYGIFLAAVFIVVLLKMTVGRNKKVMI